MQFHEIFAQPRCISRTNIPILYTHKYSPTYHSRATKCLPKIRGTDYVVFKLHIKIVCNKNLVKLQNCVLFLPIPEPAVEVLTNIELSSFLLFFF